MLLVFFRNEIPMIMIAILFKIFRVCTVGSDLEDVLVTTECFFYMSFNGSCSLTLQQSRALPNIQNFTMSLQIAQPEDHLR